jgi:hypothetical protein
VRATYRGHRDWGLANFVSRVFHVRDLFVHVVNDFKVFRFLRLTQTLQVGWLRRLFLCRQQVFGSFSLFEGRARRGRHRLGLRVVQDVGGLLAWDFQSLVRGGTLPRAPSSAHSALLGGALCRLLKNLGHFYALYNLNLLTLLPIK